MRPTLDVLKAIEAAIQIKEDGLVYYTQAARQIGDPRGKRILQSLAKDKAIHLKMFEDAREALLNREAWPSPGQASAISPREFNIPPFSRQRRFRTASWPYCGGAFRPKRILSRSTLTRWARPPKTQTA